MIFSNIYGVTRALNRIEKGMKIVGLPTLLPMALCKRLLPFSSNSMFCLINNNDYLLNA